MSASLAYIAGAVVAAWGVAHVIPTRQVLAALATAAIGYVLLYPTNG